LFKALPIEHKGTAEISDALLKKTVQRGFIFSPEVVYNYSERELLELTDDIGLTPEEMNSSFHKSWKKIREASIEQLVLEQIIHYITTYGFESLGIYNENSIYIPTEDLEIPHIEDSKLHLIIIKGYTIEELKIKLMDLLQTGIALSETTINDVLDIAEYVGVDEQNIASIKNKEVKIALYDDLNIIPQNPVEFLRYAIFKGTGKTLLIKDDSTIEAIKSGDDVSNLFFRYKQEYGFEKIAEIFYRFKPLFLAFRMNLKANENNNLNKWIINRIRRFASIYHKPMLNDYLNDFTAMINLGDPINYEDLWDALKNVNIFRRIRLAYALNYRTRDMNSILYRIRNGKSYATDFKFDDHKTARTALDMVLKSIVDKIDVEDKKIHIPKYMFYALPATEKEFTGNFPSGSYIGIPHDMVLGIYWDDVDGHRIDLDLSLIDDVGQKTGWDSEYRNAEGSILFSGDVTAAPSGASELFYIQKQNPANFIMIVNYYNYNREIEVPFKIMVAQEEVTNFNGNYIVDPNNVMSVVNSVINQKQKILGLLAVTPEESRFYFAESYLGGSITSSDKEYVMQGKEYLSEFYKYAISLNEILKMAGAILVDEKEGCDIDLSPEAIDKNSIINLLVGEKS
jgi:hypothetical protein